MTSLSELTHLPEAPGARSDASAGHAKFEAGGTTGAFRPAPPLNEPVRSFERWSQATLGLEGCLDDLLSESLVLPLVIGGHRVLTGHVFDAVLPHDRHRVLASVHAAHPDEAHAAVEAALAAAPAWAATPFEERVTVFLRAANLAAGPYRDRLVAATMLNTSKSVLEAEADVAELVDFFRFNVAALLRIYEEQPLSTASAVNRVDFRPLEGFVFAATPFNFTSIAGNLPSAPALCGNTVVWKPASTATLPAHYVMALLEEAGLPPGVVNLVYGRGSDIGPVVLEDPHLAGVHFTGSTGTFQGMWSEIGSNIGRYRAYPRLVGETGGKDFVLVHASADVADVVRVLVQGAFGYQGQKCSAASRAYVPDTLWPDVLTGLEPAVGGLVLGDVRDLHTDLGAVIDGEAFERHSLAIAGASSLPGTRLVLGGRVDSDPGWFVHPTVIETSDPGSPLMTDELFGPILTVHPYAESAFDEVVRIVDATSPYGLTGSVLARDRLAIAKAVSGLRQAAGNLYVNEKPTGAVVGQQPFGGARASGTNDKAGTMWNIMRWLSPRAIKERL